MSNTNCLSHLGAFASFDVDFHIALERVERSAEIMSHLGGEVDKRIYRNMGHTVNRDEIEAVQHILDRLVAKS